MYVRMLKDAEFSGTKYRTGQTCKLPQKLGQTWQATDICEPALAPAEVQMEFAKRLEHRSDRPALFLPFIGEFGFQIMYHVRYVHFHQAAHKIVCCRDRDKALYPTATEFFTDWRDPVADIRKVATQPNAHAKWAEIIARFPDAAAFSAGPLTRDEETDCFLLPMQRIEFTPIKRELSCDVLIGTRRRAFCPDKNWPHWNAVAAAIRAAGYTHATMGSRETSDDIPGQLFHTGDLDTDASIEALKSCRVFTGTDSGGAHLAAAVGVPMVVFRQRNHRDCLWHMRLVNPSSTTIISDGWADPAKVIAAIIQALGQGSPPSTRFC